MLATLARCVVVTAGAHPLIELLAFELPEAAEPIEACERYGIESPTFQEEGGFVIVTFRAQLGPTPQVEAPSRHQVGTKSIFSRPIHIEQRGPPRPEGFRASRHTEP